MKVKNIFNRKTKKKKIGAQPGSSIGDAVPANDTEKLIIPTDSKDADGTSGKVNEATKPTSATLNGTEAVVLRAKTKKFSARKRESTDYGLDDETKPRSASTLSGGSGKAKSSRRPWSFIEQLRRPDSRSSVCSSSVGSSIRTSQVVDDLLASTPPPGYETVTSAAPSRSGSGSCTLPRTLEPDEVEPATKAESTQSNSVKRRTVDFRFFNFFKRSSSGDFFKRSSSGGSSSQSDSAPTNSGRASFRGKIKGKKSGSGKKKRDAEDLKASVTSTDSGMDVSRMRSFSDGGETSTSGGTPLDEKLFRAALPGLNRLDERPQEAPSEKVADRRVPVNGESAIYFARDSTTSSDRQSSSSDTAVTVKSKASRRKYKGRSDPVSNGHSLLRIQMSEGSAAAIDMTRSTSGSTDSSRRSSYVSEPRNSTLPEDAVASFDSSASFGSTRPRQLHSGGSVSQIPLAFQTNKVHRALSSDTPKTQVGLGAQARCSQSVSNLATTNGQSRLSIPRSSSDVDDKPRIGRLVPQPSPHQQKLDEQGSYLRPPGAGTNVDLIPPSSPVLRAIGYPGVVLRRSKKEQTNMRPTSAYADRRTHHVFSLNVEDMPSYTQMRFNMSKAKAFPSYEDILAVQEPGAVPKRGYNGAHYTGASNGKARRKAGNLSSYGQRVSAGFATAASVDDLESLTSSNFGSKQSLSDLPRMDEDEMLNALLVKSHVATHTSSGNLRNQEPSSKRAKAIRKSVVSLANLISPGKPNQKGRLQRSSSFKESGPSTPNGGTSSAAVYSFKPYRPPANTPNKAKNNRASKLWCEMFDHAGLDEGEIKWQEAIFELYQGERDLVQDLTMAKQTYRDSMVTLKMLTDEEVTLIFGKLGCLLPLHEELLGKLEQARDKDGRTLAIGYIFVEWFPRISAAYRAYCANQSDAKYALDAAVERDARVRDFLQRCLESPFSRKLDLWSYLDLPRTRLVKFPLLLQNVLKRTPARLEEERKSLSRGLEIIGEIIERVDETTGEQQCRYIRSKLEYLDDKHRSPFIDNSRLMLCSGQLKNNRGTKMHVFLFEEAFVLTRQTTRSNKIAYQVYRHPIPLSSLVVDSSEGDKLSGSFRGGILSSEKVKHSFRVRSEEHNVSYLLQASEEHDRKQWINAIQDALAKYKAKHPGASDAQPIQFSRRRATYNHAAAKKSTHRAVLRSSSDKSNKSVCSSTDKSSVQDESQEDDASTASEDTEPWLRTRNQKNAAKLAVPCAENGKPPIAKMNKNGKGASKLKERLDSENGKSPTSLKSSCYRKQSSYSRSLDLGTTDNDLEYQKSAILRVKSEDETERARNKCQRSRSLNSSPQASKPGNTRFGANTLEIPAILAAKPPIGRNPTLSSLKPRSALQEARSTPDLSLAAASFFAPRTSSARGNAHSGSTYDPGSASSKNTAERARSLRARAKSQDYAADGAVSGASEHTVAPTEANDSVAKTVFCLPGENVTSTDDDDLTACHGKRAVDSGTQDLVIQALDEEAVDVAVAEADAENRDAPGQSSMADSEDVALSDADYSSAQSSRHDSDDSETDEQIVEKGTRHNCCRDEIPDENSKRQSNFQTS